MQRREELDLRSEEVVSGLVAPPKNKGTKDVVCYKQGTRYGVTATEADKSALNSSSIEDR